MWHCHIQAQNFFGSCTSPRKEILPQDANEVLLVDRSIYRHQLRFAWCMDSAPYHEGRGWHFHPFLRCSSPLVPHQHADELRPDHHSGTGWTWTHNKYHMRPVLVVLVPVPACPYAASAVMAMSRSEASGSTSWVVTRSWYQTSLDHAGRNTTATSPDQLYPDSRRWEKPFSPHYSDKGRVFPWCGHPQLPKCQSGLWIALPVSRTWWRTMEIPPPDTAVSLDIALWDSPRPDNRTMSSSIPGYWLIGWHDCHFVLKLQFMHSDSTQLNDFHTNATPCLLGQLQEYALPRNGLIGAGQNHRWTVKFLRGGGLLKIAGGTLVKLT